MPETWFIVAEAERVSRILSEEHVKGFPNLLLPVNIMVMLVLPAKKFSRSGISEKRVMFTGG